MSVNVIIQAATIITALGTIGGGFIWIDSTYAKVTDMKSISVQIAYDAYYDRLDDYEESLAEGREEHARELKRQMERLKAIICEDDPEWERCKEDVDSG